MPSTPVVNAIGALGGAVLAACLLPQIYRLYRTRSARDLAYLYLAAYATGLFLTFLYLYWEGATVAWICILIEMGFAIAVMGAKVYLDNYGPHSRRGKERSATDANDQVEDVKSPGESDNPSVQCLGDQDQTRSSLRMRDAEVLAKGSTAHKRESIASLAMPQKSRYTLIVENLDSYTRSRDVKEECRFYGHVVAVERDIKSRSALVEFERSSAAQHAYDKLHGFMMDGKQWRVNWATIEDFKFFGWKWTEGNESPPRQDP